MRLSSADLPSFRLGEHGKTLGRFALCMLLGAGLVAGAVALRQVLVQGDRFALHEVRFGPLRHLDEAKLLDESGLRIGQSLFAIDTTAAERRLAKEPWIASVRIRRELPHTVSVELVEREAKVAVSLGSLYLVDERGELFKRASGDEQAGLPVVTGLLRERYAADPQAARGILRRAIELDRTWRDHGVRAPIGELHHESGRDAAATFTAYFDHGKLPVAVRLGSADATTPDRLRRLDAVLAALDRSGQRAALVHLDQRVQLDRVAVRLWSHEQAVDGAQPEDGAPSTQAL